MKKLKQRLAAIGAALVVGVAGGAVAGAESASAYSNCHGIRFAMETSPVVTPDNYYVYQTDGIWLQECGAVLFGRFTHAAYVRAAYDAFHHSAWVYVKAGSATPTLAISGSYWNGHAVWGEEWTQGILNNPPIVGTIYI